MTTSTPSFPVSEARVDERATRLTHAIAERIRDVMGNMTQRALAKRLGYSSGSTVSAHLNGRTNLTLKTVVQYAVALDATIVSVPRVERPKKRRRRRGRTRRVSDQRKALRDIDPVKQALHSLLSDLTARIGQILDADDELSQRELARRIGRDEAYVSRVLAGGVNVTLKTVAAFDVALNTRLLRVEGVSPKKMLHTSHQGRSSARLIRRISDGGSYANHGGVCDTMNNYLTRTAKSASASESVAEPSPCLTYG
jgi:transcriptional regulator with XRE-family HTH domain